MKYLIINGSPHKGNTWLVARAALRKIEELDLEGSFQEVHLMELNLPFCTGCSNCFRLGNEYCPHQGIISKVIEKMKWADGILVVSTTFNCRETALLKNFLDHLSFLLHRPLFFYKKVLVITTVGGVGGKATVKSIAGTMSGMGANKCYGICIRSISWNAYIITPKAQKIIDKISKKFYKDVSSRKMHFPKTSVLIPYNLFRGMADNYVCGAEYETKDGEYYSEINRKQNVYNSKIPLRFSQKVFGNLFYLIGKIGANHMVVTYKKSKK